MFDCNLIKSREQRMQENQLQNLQPQTAQIPTIPIPGAPENPTPPPTNPSMPNNPQPNNPASGNPNFQYLNEYLRSQIGEYVEVEFLIGTTNRVIVYGILQGVGFNYILLEDPIANTILACDFYTIKFVKILPSINPD
ncbi:MAG: hypothetical protein ACOX5F_03180 [Anaerovoracaceae bacterium]|jgi:hypothetical protein